MRKLEAVTVLRKGETETEYYVEQTEVSITHDHLKNIELDLSIPSKGGGVTCLKIRIGPDGFGRIIDNMVYADRLLTLIRLAEEVTLGLQVQKRSDEHRTWREERKAQRAA